MCEPCSSSGSQAVTQYSSVTVSTQAGQLRIERESADTETEREREGERERGRKQGGLDIPFPDHVSDTSENFWIGEQYQLYQFKLRTIESGKTTSREFATIERVRGLNNLGGHKLYRKRGPTNTMEYYLLMLSYLFLLRLLLLRCCCCYYYYYYY